MLFAGSTKCCIVSTALICLVCVIVIVNVNFFDVKRKGLFGGFLERPKGMAEKRKQKIFNFFVHFLFDNSHNNFDSQIILSNQINQIES